MLPTKSEGPQILTSYCRKAVKWKNLKILMKRCMQYLLLNNIPSFRSCWKKSKYNQSLYCINSVFFICAEAIKYLLLYNLHDCTFNNQLVKSCGDDAIILCFFLVHIFPHSDWIRTRKNSEFGDFSHSVISVMFNITFSCYVGVVQTHFVINVIFCNNCHILI